ncbi:DUF2334 domain-containing protein [Pseudonocardia sp. C8]|uniref:DUF2334 domain-containing protein n=1 Tax=Pseudonocardia sp. C8 TaxID=2762759 RepID=UPI0016425FC3|nr:DUF2334 domain-containing protein [Pseudonocardia sp. C8]MBC3194106.1 DUF2334 domain-containing protein [Pseudonocardia sp. C8]
MSTLLVSLSGLTDATDADRARAVAFAAELDRLGVPLTHLVQPKGPEHALRRGDDLVRWIAGRVGAGDDVLLHGYDHTADPVGSWQNGAVPRIGRRSEFGALPRHEAGLRLTAARRVLTATGLSTDGFAAPRWVASAGTLEALAEHGFGLCADETSLRVPGGPVLRAKVLTFRSSEPWLGSERATGDRRRGRALQQQAVRIADRGGIVRIALRAKDLRKPHRADAALAAVDAARNAGAAGAVHRGLFPAAAPAA